MMTLLKALFHDESGQDLAEYGIALSIIAGTVAVIALAISDNVNGLWSNAQGDLATVVSGN
jgi:Flp pilus assembly pilin Flp